MRVGGQSDQDSRIALHSPDALKPPRLRRYQRALGPADAAWDDHLLQRQHLPTLAAPIMAENDSMMMPANIFPRISHTSSKEWSGCSGSAVPAATIMPRNAVNRNRPWASDNHVPVGAKSVPFPRPRPTAGENQQGRKTSKMPNKNRPILSDI